MTEEFDPTYKETSLHACITCRCGTKVWYGYGIQHKTRPKYCKTCERLIAMRFFTAFGGKPTSQDLQEFIESDLRAEIIHPDTSETKRS